MNLQPLLDSAVCLYIQSQSNQTAIYNLGHILKFHNIFVQLSFTSSKGGLNIQQEHFVYGLPQDFPNKLRLRILGGYEIVGISEKTGETEDLSKTGNTHLFTNEVISCFCGCTFKP